MAEHSGAPGASDFTASGWQDFTFLADKQVDRLMHVVISLAAEQWVTRRRLGVIERIMSERGLVTPADIEAYVPSEAEHADDLAERGLYMARVFGVLAQGDTDRG